MFKAKLISMLAISLFVASSAFADARSCLNLFSSSVWQESGGKPLPEGATLKIAIKEQGESHKVSEYVMSELRRDSEGLLTKYKDKTLEVEVLCLGAGPQCAAASLVLGKNSIKSVVVEKTDFVAKTFAEKDFYINSVEAFDLSMHDFPGGASSLANLTSQMYAHSSQLATHIQSQQFASGVPVLLNTEILSAREVTKNGAKYIELETNQGITLLTKTLLLGTGLGEVGTKVREVEYQKEFAEHHQDMRTSTALQPIMSTDSFLVTLKNSRAKKVAIQLPRDVVLIGNGDGSRIAIEAYSDKNVTLPKHFKTHWIGNNFKTATQYQQAQGQWDRYLPKIIPHYNNGRLVGIPGHVDKIEKLASGRFRVTVKDSKTGALQAVEGDMIIDSTGYTNKNKTILEQLAVAPELTDVLGPLKELNLDSTVIARQYLTTQGERLPVYAVGASAGMLATEAELSSSPNKNPVSIFNTVPRTSQFVSQLINVPAFLSVRGVREFRPPVKTSKELILELNRQRAASPLFNGTK